ncbi:hypothetical protein ACUOA8_48265, partial [Escherichia sp. SS-MK2]
NQTYHALNHDLTCHFSVDNRSALYQNYGLDQQRFKFDYTKDKDWRDYQFDNKRFDHQVKNDNRNYGLERDRFNHTVRNDDRNYDLDINRFNHTVKNDDRNYN